MYRKSGYPSENENGWKDRILECEKCINENDLKGFDYNSELLKLKDVKKNIENLCFAGGGMRCIGYLGALLICDKLDILKKVKRFSGTSGGSIFALLCCLEYNIDEIYNIVSQDQSKYLDREYKWLTWWYYLFYNNFGLHPGKVLENDIRKYINDKFDKDFPKFRTEKGTDYNPTFKDLYDLYKKELLLTGTNLSKLSVDIFCPKLTPDMPVYIAVRISASLPGCFESVVYNGMRYIDGGLAENYPLDLFCDDSKYIFKMDNEKVFENSFGFALLSPGVTIIKDPDGIKDEIENNKAKSITTAGDYVYSIIDFYCTQNFEDEMTIINLKNPTDKHCFLKHTIMAYTPCLSTDEFDAKINNKLDTITIFKYLTLKFLTQQVVQN